MTESAGSDSLEGCTNRRMTLYGTPKPAAVFVGLAAMNRGSTSRHDGSLTSRRPFNEPSAVGWDGEGDGPSEVGAKTDPR